MWTDIVLWSNFPVNWLEKSEDVFGLNSTTTRMNIYKIESSFKQKYNTDLSRYPNQSVSECVE
jgi:hypothetical protein